MKSYRKELWFNAPKRRQIIHITPQVEECLRESGVKEGLALVNAMHITASVFINDNESGLHSDFERWLEKLAPEKPYEQYEHNGYEDNADAHLKRTVKGSEAVVAATEESSNSDPGSRSSITNSTASGKRVLVSLDQARAGYLLTGSWRGRDVQRFPSRRPHAAPPPEDRRARRGAG